MVRLRRAMLALLMVVGLTIPGMAVSAHGGADGTRGMMRQGEGFPLQAITAFCENMTGGPLDGCTPWDGVTVWFSVEHESGNYETSCVTSSSGGRAAGCGITVPFGSTVTASIDMAEIPAGYVLIQSPVQVVEIPDGPPEGEFGGPVFTLDLAAEEPPTEEPATEEPATEEPIVEPTAPAAAVPTVAPTVAPVTGEQAWEDRRVELVQGECALDKDQGSPTILAELAPVTLTEGDRVGSEQAAEIGTSTTSVDLGLDGIMAEPSSIVVYANDDDDAEIIACGAIGGVIDPEGNLVIMLQPQNDSGYAGVATLAPNPDDEAKTDITIYLGEIEQ